MAVFDSSDFLLAQHAPPAIRAIVLAAAAGLALAAFRVKSSSLRLSTWTVVLYAAIAMPLLGWILPSLTVPMPESLTTIARRASQTAQPTQFVETKAVSEDHASARSGSNRSSATFSEERSAELAPIALSRHATPVRPVVQWSLVAAGAYLVVAAFLLLRLIAGWWLGTKMVRRSRAITDTRLTSRLEMRRNATRLSFTPQAAESELISVPVTVGVMRSIIVLPTDWREWDDMKLDAVIAHEVSHLARRDALTQCLALIHRAVFWFSPLSWWLYVHLAGLAEQTSDEAALSSGADRNDYARTLLGFFEALRTTPGRVWWQGVSMAKAGQAEERVERILAWKKAGGAVTMSLKKPVLIAVILFAIPVVYLAASVRPAFHGQSESPTPPAQARELAPAPAAVAIAPAAPVARTQAVSPPTALAPVAPVALAFAPTAWPGQSHGAGASHSGYSFSYGYNDEQRFVIVTGNSDSLTMSGSSEDAHHVERLRKQIAGDFIWFERDEKTYIIRDQATINRARSLWAPQEELGKKQEELGKQQDELGRQQDELGAKMEQVKIDVPDMTAELDKLKAKLQKLGSSATMDQIGDLQSEIGDLQSKIGEIQSRAGEKQSKLGDEQGALGEKQGKLGEKQGELGEQQAKLAQEATRQMKSLLDEAIKNGKAQPEPETGGTGTL
jgi:beta-lactamase regulating signal transducer with metallopeptidase domain